MVANFKVIACNERCGKPGKSLCMRCVTKNCENVHALSINIDSYIATSLLNFYDWRC